MKGFNKSLTFVTLFFVALSCHAGVDDWYAKVGSILIDDEAYGGCMADIVPAPSTRAALNCTTTWVSFNCLGLSQGAYVSPGKASGQTKLAAAQLGLVTGNYVKVYVRDDVKFNNQCLATQVTNTSTPAP